MSRTRFETGLSAEVAVVQRYRAAGAELLAERMRNAGGEIDLIFRQGAEIIFVEVKARKSHDKAALSLGQAQMARIMTAAEIWLDECGLGTNHPCRFDLALVDGQGAVEVIENALTA